MDNKDQTSKDDSFEEGVDNVTLITEDDVDENGDELTEDQKKSTDETADDEKTSEEVDYKEKFGASTKEAQRLATENKLLQGEAEKAQGRYSTLETAMADMEKKFAAEDPEKYDAIKTKKDLGELKEKLLLQEERGAVDDYLESNPKAAAQKEALKRLGRAFPDKTYEDLWNENFKPYVPEEGDDGSATETKAKKKSQPEKGDGTMSEMTSTGMTLDEFRKLPLNKRKAILLKNGGKF